MRNVILTLCAAGAFSAAAHAQPWPAKPVRVIVNVAPGGVADVTMRVLGARLTETMGQAFIVENRAGGDGYIGFEAVAPGRWQGETLYLIKPGSFMNVTGGPMARLARKLHLGPADLVVVFDDIDLPLGKVRVRQTGSGPSLPCHGEPLKCSSASALRKNGSTSLNDQPSQPSDCQ